jgi:hypothetical protein
MTYFRVFKVNSRGHILTYTDMMPRTHPETPTNKIIDIQVIYIIPTSHGVLNKFYYTFNVIKWRENKPALDIHNRQLH